MEFYKILKMDKNENSNFYNFLDMFDCEFFTGNYLNSFAIKYNPETYNQMLNNEIFFNEFINHSVQQLFVTNQKFLTLLNYSYLFELKVTNCLFDEVESDSYFDEFDEFSFESIEKVVSNFSFCIKQITYITNDSKRFIILQKNGVIGIDKGLTIKEKEKILKFIDTLNFGLKVIKNEKNYL